jgi:hypothetical protein
MSCVKANLLPGLLLAAVLFVGSGCSSNYVLEVESRRAPQYPPGLDAVSYNVMNVVDDSTIDGGKLRRVEAARIVRTALEAHGMYEAPSPERANVLLDIQYGMRPGRIQVDELTNEQRGHEKGSVRVTQVREKHLQITARAAKSDTPGQPPLELWTVSVRNLDETGDLRKYLTILAEVAAEWSGRNTHGTRTFTATLEDGVVVYVSGGYEQPGLSPELPE